jgi:hypothetical protein
MLRLMTILLARQQNGRYREGAVFYVRERVGLHDRIILTARGEMTDVAV